MNIMKINKDKKILKNLSDIKVTKKEDGNYSIEIEGMCILDSMREGKVKCKIDVADIIDSYVIGEQQTNKDENNNFINNEFNAELVLKVECLPDENGNLIIFDLID